MVTQGKTALLTPPALKICGVRTEVDAFHCLAAGVDFVGFNFYPGSKRYIAPVAAAAFWQSALRELSSVPDLAPNMAARTRPVAVFVNATEAEVAAALAAFPQLSAVQFHGDETPEELAQLLPALGGRSVWKALGVRGANDIERAAAFAVIASLVLFDAPPDGGHAGGTGRRFPWHLVTDFAADVEMGLAGGLRPGMLHELHASLRPRIPALIDVCSGVETAPGQKDPSAIAAMAAELRALSWGIMILLLLAGSLFVGPNRAVAQGTEGIGSGEEGEGEKAEAPAASPSPRFDVNVTELLSHQDMHRWERHVRGFRREHNFALTAGVTSGSWSVQWSGEDSPRSYENTGIYSRFQYAFHLPLYQGFGYILGSGIGYLYESVDRRRSFRPVSALQYPGLLTGLTLNINPVLRISSTFEAYLERHTGIEGRTTTGEDREIHVTLQAYDAGLCADIFYDLNWAIRIEGHIRHVEYLKPAIKSGSYPVDARLHKDDRWLGMGLVFHLL